MTEPATTGPRYLITGAQGMVGRYLTAHILAEDKDAHVLGLGRSASLPGFFTHSVTINGKQQRAPVPKDLVIQGRYRYQQLSLLMTDRLREVVERFEPTVVFHLAAALHTATEPELFAVNVEGTRSLMSALANTKALVILGGSAGVYGDGSLPLSESQPCNPNDLYGITKLAAEQIVRVKAARSGLGFISARIFNLVGAGQSENYVCGRIAAQLAAATKPTTLSAGPVEATRDFIDVRDVAAALLLLAQKGERGGAYNIATGRETPIHVILSELVRIAGLKGQVEIVSKPPEAVSRQVGKTARLRRIGFTPTHSLQQSLEDLFNYHRAL
ncbi:MAG TPA: NAD-dependent epimerase/dehydratase family protein [Myxococcales bacterium]|nr:NAD-dependent epimerase/dehydratase family protein [Myxococcales bacterium]